MNPATPAHHHLLLRVAHRTELILLADSSAAFSAQSDLGVRAGYLAFPFVLADSLAALGESELDPWGSYLLIDPQASEVVGLVGFLGPPKDGHVEFGLSVAPSCRGLGYGTYAARELVAIAASAGVSRVWAHTAPAPNSSVTLLEHCGFRKELEFTDPQDGPTWRWEKSATQGSG